MRHVTLRAGAHERCSPVGDDLRHERVLIRIPVRWAEAVVDLGLCEFEIAVGRAL